MSYGEMTPADFAAVTKNEDGFGGNGAWWLIVLFLFAFSGGWNNGGAFGGSRGAGAVDGYVLTSDFATVERKLDTVQAGICDSTFALNNTIVNGFNTAELSRCNQQAALMAQLNAMALNDQKCCCETQRLLERGFADTNYNIASQTRDIVENQNCNTRAILDFLTNDKISALTAENQSLKLAASQSAQNAYLISALSPKVPNPAYIVPNPNCCYANGCGTSCIA